MAFDSFMKGFLSRTSKNITERKEEANDYYNKKMELAFSKAHEFRSRNKAASQAALQSGRQLQAIGVPNDLIIGIANQNPDDLATFYQSIEKMRLNGQKFNEDSYRAMFDVQGEVATDESVSQFITRLYEPLSANIAANPEGFEFDPKGTIWATAMGYNAMDKANRKLAQTEVLPGVSATDVLEATGGPNVGMGGTGTVTLNANWVGDRTRALDNEQKGDRGVSISERNSITTAFDELVTKHRKSFAKDDGTYGPDIEAQAEQAALQDMLKIYKPEDLAQIPYLADKIAKGSESPSEGRTETVAPPATPTPAPTSTPSGKLPEGARLVKQFPNGDKGYTTPDGKKYLVKAGPSASEFEDSLKNPTGN